MERARRALAEAGAPEAAVVEVVRRRLSPGRPRRVDAASDPSYRTLDLPDGRTLRAAREGTMGDWVVAVGDTDDAWRGRSLFGVLYEALELPFGRVDDWVADVICRLAGRKTPDGIRYECALAEPPPGTYEICDACGWEDDHVQFEIPTTRAAPTARACGRRARRSDRQEPDNP